MNPDQARALTPEQRNQGIGEATGTGNQKAQFFEAVVDVMKNDYGLSVTKKRPGKSSRASKPRD